LLKVKKFLVLTLVLVLFSSLVACGKETNGSSTDGKSLVKIGLLTGVAGLGDKSFNDLSYDGAKKAEKDLGIKLKVVEPGDLSAAEGLLRDLVKAGNDMVVAVGFDMVDPLKVVAKEYPDKKFAVIDAVVDLPNVQSLLFKEHEGSFLIGALAAMMTKTDKVATIPAMDVPFLNRFSKAFEQGAKYIKPDINVTIQPIGSDMSSFNDPGKMKNIALSMYSHDIDVIYPVAGGSGTGLFEAAKEKGKYAFGINSNQDDMAKGLVLTSMVKRCDVAVFNSIKSFVDKQFKGGIQTYGLENDGIGLTDFKYTKDVIGEENIKKIDGIKDDIITGKIKVIDVTEVK
jgi:basic membrane protein A